MMTTDEQLLEALEDKKETKAEEVAPDETKKKKRRYKKHVPVGHVYVKATFNNTIVTITDPQGNVLAAASAGTLGYTGTKKSTPYVAGLAAGQAATKAKNYGMTEVHVFIRGIGSGRESSVRALAASGLSVTAIKDITPVPHGGCRRKKVRRV